MFDNPATRCLGNAACKISRKEPIEQNEVFLAELIAGRRLMQTQTITSTEIAADRSLALASGSQKRGVELTIVVPTFNECENVELLLARLDAALGEIAWEVVYVDDDLPDGTADRVRTLAQSDPRVRILQRIGRRGLATAVIEGMLASSAPYPCSHRRRSATRRDVVAANVHGDKGRRSRHRHRQPP